MQSNAGVLQTSFFTMFLYRTVIFTKLINNRGKLKKAAWFQHRLVFSKEHVSKMDDEQLLTLAFSDRLNSECVPHLSTRSCLKSCTLFRRPDGANYQKSSNYKR